MQAPTVLRGRLVSPARWFHGGVTETPAGPSGAASGSDPHRPIARWRRGTIALLAGVLVVAAVLAGLGLAPGSRRTAPSWFDRAFVIVLENAGYRQIVGNRTDAPYLNGLIARYGLATDWVAPAHPSYPDYLALVTGSTFQIRDDQPRDLDARSLFDQLEEHHRTWHVYAQGYPGGCFLGDQAQSGPDLGPAGTYVRRHVPALSFRAVTADPTRCANVTALGSFDPGAADFELIVPNDANNMHDGSIRQGDDFLASFVPRIVGSPVFEHAALFITWDEGTDDDGGGGLVPMIVVRPGITPGFTSPVRHSHRALVRTIEDSWGLGCLPATCDSEPAAEFFAPPSADHGSAALRVEPGERSLARISLARSPMVAYLPP